MTREEYTAKEKEIKEKRTKAFKKVQKYDKELKNLYNEFATSNIDLKKGDRLIVIDGNDNKEYLRVKSIVPNSSNVIIHFTRLSEKWTMPRKWNWCKDAMIELFSVNDWAWPKNYKWIKVNADGTTDTEGEK